MKKLVEQEGEGLEASGNEMKCNQCGRYVDKACTRTDCGVNETATEAETRRVYRKERNDGA